MGKQNKSRKPELIGKGKVTPVQVAFIVDRYLSDNNYINTRSTFRSEASHLIAKSPVQEAPKSLLCLGAILDEYITLKEQKVLLDQLLSRTVPFGAGEIEASEIANGHAGCNEIWNKLITVNIARSIMLDHQEYIIECGNVPESDMVIAMNNSCSFSLPNQHVVPLFLFDDGIQNE